MRTGDNDATEDVRTFAFVHDETSKVSALNPFYGQMSGEAFSSPCFGAQ